jgi:hypothetical protein
MATFTIDTENNITPFVHPHEGDVVIGSEQTFTSPEELTDLARWLARRAPDRRLELVALPDLARTSSRLRGSRTGRRQWHGSGRPFRD